MQSLFDSLAFGGSEAAATVVGRVTSSSQTKIRVMQELTAAEDAKKVIDTLSVTSPDNPNTLEALRHIYDRARRANSPTTSSDDAAAARNKALLALNDIIGSLQARRLTPARIDRGKVALDAWIKLLKWQLAASSTVVSATGRQNENHISSYSYCMCATHHSQFRAWQRRFVLLHCRVCWRPCL